MIVDLWGMVSNELKADAGIVAIVGQKVRSEWATGESPPAVILEGLATTYSLGPGTRRLGLQVPTLIAKCYGVKKPGAQQLANAVVEAINMRGPRTDATGRLIFASLVESGDPDIDPITKWPHVDVIFRLVGAQQAVAVA